MMSKLEIVIVLIILISVAIILVKKIISLAVAEIFLAIVLIGLSIVLYRVCQKKKVKKQGQPFWKQYWHDLKCQNIVIVFAVASVALGVEVLKYLEQ